MIRSVTMPKTLKIMHVFVRVAAVCAAASGLLGCEADDQTLKAVASTQLAAAAECTTASDCPVPANTCFGASCTAGKCGAAVAKDETKCDDGNVCNSGDKCTAGVCKGGADDKKCDDGDACTGDACDPKVGCIAPPLDSKCDDNNPCTTDACAKGACTHANNDTAVCDDDNSCTVGDGCAGGKCKSGETKACDDGNVCTTDSCDPDLGCVGKNNTAPCSDNNACTKGDECVDGECRVGKVAISCDDANACTDDACDPKTGCATTAIVDGKPCTDGNACTDGDACKAGKCAGGAVNLCDDSTPCTTDSCDAKAGCKHDNSTALCDDGNTCTEGDLCGGGKCGAGLAKNCDDGNSCTTDSCDAKAGCQTTATTAACDDKNLCTTGDACKNKACAAGADKPDCDDKNACTDDACDPTKGCTHTNNTVVCDDKDPKTVGDMCGGGMCMGSVPNDPTPTCAAYCDAIQLACGSTGTTAQFASKNECTNWCSDNAMWVPGKASDKAGNTIGCRTYHATVAKVDAVAAALHCPHAGKTGGNVCGTWCENYCGIAMMNCKQSLGFADDKACSAACGLATPNATAGDTSGYSLQCMIVQGGLAANDPTLCSSMNIGGTGTGMCKAPVKATTAKVATANFAFTPKETTIKAGDSVEFTLEGNHNVVEVEKATYDANGSTAKTGGFSIGFGKTQTILFDKAGVYYFVCEPHAAGGMKGMITVQ